MHSYYEMIGYQHPGGPVAEGAPPVPDMSRTSFFIDFDGTLIDPCPRPGDVRVPRAAHEALGDLVRLTGGAVALITGRDLDEVRRLLPDFDGAIIAAHGAEWRLGGRVERHPMANSPEVKQMARIAAAFAATDPRMTVEPKATGVAIHVRDAPDLEGEAYRFMEGLHAHFPNFAVSRGRGYTELRPIGTSRLNALRAMMTRPPFLGRTPLYVGDDMLDEQAMRYVAELGGVAIKVGDSESFATHRLRSPAHLHRCLSSWCAAEPVA